jgi:non-heme chloroperoxidase
MHPQQTDHGIRTSTADRPSHRSVIAAADGTLLFCKTWGSGRPVLFVHSWALNSDMWQYQMVALAARGFACSAYDQRGHGRSGQPGHGHDYDTLADDLAAVIAGLDLTDLTLVGHSMGCGVIIRYLTRHGAGRIARTALLAPITPFLLKTPDNPEGIDRGAFETVREAMRTDFPKWLDDNARPFVTTDTSVAMIDWLKGLMLQCALKAAIDCNIAVSETDFRAEMAAIAVPSLIIHGDADVSAPLALTGERSAQLMPNARLIVEPGAPHGLFVTHMARVNTELAAFMGC